MTCERGGRRNSPSSTVRPALRKPLPHCGPTSRFSAARCISIATFSLMLPNGCMTNFPLITRI
jgi:hypothetical protein